MNSKQLKYCQWSSASIYVKDDEVEEDEQQVDEDTHDELQFADYASRIL